ncbi:hypothetical protein SAMN04489760_10790 [Syntrophus gentianae]|uniref:DUF948 domain-containing protein n=1 Tax=Syntrophus gentianae TaxID=43775 RepID=A0A1H7WR90_9BACT|nr:DUF948 domain-containing protein [Syntrophus gentianae]SEM23417.1 hypothetical protein SAMN04489760_10790 [Syntrophus gentianae]
MNLEITNYVLLGFLLLLAILVLPLLYQLWRTVEQLTLTLRTLNSRLPAILKNLEDITGNLNETTTSINMRVAELSLVLQRVFAFLGAFRGAEQLVRSQTKSPLLRLVNNARPIVKGVKTFFQVLNTSPRDPV